MRVIACGLLADVAQVRRRGAGDALLGALLDAGSYGPVEDVAPAPAGLDRVLGDGLDRAAAAAGVRLVRRSWPGSDRTGGAEPELPASALVVWDGWRGADDGGLAAAETAWHRHLASGAAVSVVVADRRESEPPLWVLCGHGLPSMGAVAGAVRADLWATWWRLAGASTGGSGRDLLEEEVPEGLDPVGEAALTERLRQLYGE